MRVVFNMSVFALGIVLIGAGAKLWLACYQGVELFSDLEQILRGHDIGELSLADRLYLMEFGIFDNLSNEELDETRGYLLKQAMFDFGVGLVLAPLGLSVVKKFKAIGGRLHGFFA